MKEIEVYLSGGVIQHVKIPEDSNVKVIVKDYDISEMVDIEEAIKEGFNIKKDLDGDYYEEGIWEE